MKTQEKSTLQFVLANDEQARELVRCYARFSISCQEQGDYDGRNAIVRDVNDIGDLQALYELAQRIEGSPNQWGHEIQSSLMEDELSIKWTFKIFWISMNFKFVDGALCAEVEIIDEERKCPRSKNPEKGSYVYNADNSARAIKCDDIRKNKLFFLNTQSYDFFKLAELLNSVG